MNTKTLFAIIGGVIVVGAAIFLLRGPGMGNNPIQKTSLKALLAVNSPQKCTFKNTTGVAETSGTVYVMHGRMRGDFESATPGRTEKNHMIVEDNKTYVWADLMPQGMMMDFSELEKPDNKQQSTDVNKEIDYTCNSWSPDESVFQKPAGVEFTDFKAMMQGGGMMQDGNMMPNGNTGTVQNPNYSDAKKMQCAACDSAPTPEAKTQCKTALGCQ